MDRKRIPDKHRAHFIERYRQVQREAIAARVAARLQGAERISVYGDNSAVRVFGPPHQGKTRLLRTFLETTGDGKVVGRLLSEDGSPIADGADLPPGHYRFEVVLDEVQDNV